MRARLLFFAPLAGVVVLSLFFYAVLPGGAAGDRPAGPRSALLGQPVPPFRLPVLGGGAEHGAEVLQGRMSLVNVWATWCPECLVEHDFLMQLARDGVHLVGLNYKDDEQMARQWLARLGDPYAVNLADARGLLALDLGVRGAPESFLVDARGIIVQHWTGALDARIWERHFARHYTADKATTGEQR